MADISRRAMLRGVSLAGAASVGAATGVGTHALLTDGELFDANSLSSGSLDLQVAARATADGETSYTPAQAGPFPSSFADDSGVTIEFPMVDPHGVASGTATIALRVCDNPGRVWLRPRSNASDSELADRLDVTLAYATRCGAAGDIVYEGSLSGLLDALEGGTPLGASCRELGKVELDGDTFVVEAENGAGDSLAVGDVPGSLTFDGPDGPVTIDITGLHWKDEGEDDAEVRGVDLGSGAVEFCRADVKGGGSPDDGVETYRLDCASTATGLLAGETPSGRPSGLSHFVVYDCPDVDPCVGCDPACLTLDWELRNAKRVAGESLSLDLELHASQCRHSTPNNPWQ